MGEDGVPASAMVIMAHPDDAEFTVAGTVATWTRAGCRVIYVLCTDGDVGSHEPGMTRERLAQIRRTEQRAACDILGVREVVFLGHGDGELEPTLQLRRELVRAIRHYEPEVVIAADPTQLFVGNWYINHPDHRAAALAAVDAVAPACRMPLLWPELGAPHHVQRLYVHSHDAAEVFVDISDVLPLKIAALKEHKSQMRNWDPCEMITEWAVETGRQHGVRYAEQFRVINL